MVEPTDMESGDAQLQGVILPCLLCLLDYCNPQPHFKLESDSVSHTPCVRHCATLKELSGNLSSLT